MRQYASNEQIGHTKPSRISPPVSSLTVMLDACTVRPARSSCHGEPWRAEKLGAVMDGQIRKSGARYCEPLDTDGPLFPPSRRRARTVVSLFSGAGGLDLGLEAAGWHILAQIEMDEDCVGTLRNQAHRRSVRTEILNDRIEDISPRALRKRLGLERGELTLLAGGPPCQPFTTSGLRQAINDRRASSLFPAYFKFVDEFRPRVLLIENVDGLLSAALRHRPLMKRGWRHPPMRPEEQKGSFLQWFLNELVRKGYSMSWGVAEAADYGVPQMRQRAILIGVLGDQPCYLPQARFGNGTRRRYRTVRAALKRLKELGPVQPLSERKRYVYSLIPAGGNWRDLSDTMRRRTMGAAYAADGGKSGWWRRLSWDTPAPTILGMPDHSSTGLIHPDEVRCLSINECAAIQTFPRHVRFAGSPRSQYQQIGNAVPVLLAKALGDHVQKVLDGEHMKPPAPPPWRQQSANRRIGTHGWIVARRRSAECFLNVQVRSDHIWAADPSEAVPA
jgi:DNA (cytosine-5)-methyltransferase 1